MFSEENRNVFLNLLLVLRKRQVAEHLCLLDVIQLEMKHQIADERKHQLYEDETRTCVWFAIVSSSSTIIIVNAHS